jgi:hypothetical protein
MAALTPALKEQWDRDGWCIVPGLIPPGDLPPAQHAMHRHFPTPPEMTALGGALTKYVQQATPRQLALMGVPEPGHRYWNEATLAGVQARYPGLDMHPWREALR